MNGLVIRTTGSWYRVLVQDTPEVLPSGSSDFQISQSSFHEYDCRLRGKFRTHNNKQTNPIAVGDHVVFELQQDGTGLITEVEERTNCIIRRATKLSKQTHVLASNIDLLCVVATLGFPRTSTGFIDRMLVTAEAYHIPACLIINKIDLCEEFMEEVEELKRLYENAGYPVYLVSALTGVGVATLQSLVAGKVVLFSGHSGVGKSALLNTFNPDLHLRVGEVSDWSLKGKHTTTFAEIFPIALAGSDQTTYLIDSPGIKEFGMVDFTAEELSHFFPEMRSRLHDCQFSNCTHRHEPHCAIKAAVESGEIAEERYINYLNIIDSLDDNTLR